MKSYPERIEKHRETIRNSEKLILKAIMSIILSPLSSPLSYSFLSPKSPVCDGEDFDSITGLSLPEISKEPVSESEPKSDSKKTKKRGKKEIDPQKLENKRQRNRLYAKKSRGLMRAHRQNLNKTHERIIVLGKSILSSEYPRVFSSTLQNCLQSIKMKCSPDIGQADLYLEQISKIFQYLFKETIEFEKESSEVIHSIEGVIQKSNFTQSLQIPLSNKFVDDETNHLFDAILIKSPLLLPSLEEDGFKKKRTRIPLSHYMPIGSTMTIADLKKIRNRIAGKKSRTKKKQKFAQLENTKKTFLQTGNTIFSLLKNYLKFFQGSSSIYTANLRMIYSLKSYPQMDIESFYEEFIPSILTNLINHSTALKREKMERMIPFETLASLLEMNKWLYDEGMGSPPFNEAIQVF